jgi:hypothetical protein
MTARVDIAQTEMRVEGHRYRAAERGGWDFSVTRRARQINKRSDAVMSREFTKSLSRRTVLIAAAGIAPLMVAGRSQAAGLPPTAVAYQTTPKDGKQCADCTFFIAPNSCKSVSGEIAPTGWCKLYVKKA